MNNYSQCSVLVPCHSLEDFPTHHTGNDAENLLAAWTAVWHPALIASSGKAPNWLRAGIDEVEIADALIVVPNVAEHSITDSFRQTAVAQRAVLISRIPLSDRDRSADCDGSESPVASAEARGNPAQNRAAIVAQALDNNAAARAANQHIDADFANDFFALGYAFLQIQLMTRQLRYSSNLNQTVFDEHLVSAAISAAAGKSELAKQDLTACFDLLMEEKNNYYPVQPELIDVVLIAETTLRNSLTQQLTVQHPFNMVLTGQLAERLQTLNPAAIETLRGKIETEQVSIIGGLQTELPDPLISIESVVRQLAHGRATIESIFKMQPTVFFRRRYGLTPTLPGLLDQFNFVGAVHATLDDGKFPLGSSSNIRWTGYDGQSIPAYGSAPLAADDSGVMLRLGLNIGEQIDSAHLATLMFVHWPDLICDSFRDVIRISDYCCLFGRFTRAEDYFDAVYDPGFGDSFSADEYSAPYLKQAVASQQLNPISRFVDYWHAHYQLVACRSLLTQLAFRQQSNVDPDELNRQAEQLGAPQLEKIAALERRLDQAIDSTDPTDFDKLSSDIDTLLGELVEHARSVSSPANETHHSAPTPEHPTYCVINPTNAKRRVHGSTPTSTSLTRLSPPPLMFADSKNQRTDFVAEVAGMSQAGFQITSSDSKDALKSDPAVLEGNRLQNEFFQLLIDDQTGGIRSIQLHGGRDNLISQQLAVRVPTRNSAGQPLSRARYSTMAVDRISHHASTRIGGTISTTGRLLDGERVLATFEQHVTVRRGIPIADLEIEIELLSELAPVNHHYVCNRLAWKDESASVTANFQEAQQHVAGDWFLATNFIQLEQDEHSLTLLTGGLPYHRRASRRMLDTLLIVGNEQRRRFRFGIGVDVKYPLMAASQWMMPSLLIEGGPKLASADDWLFHFNCKNILVTKWQPLFDSGTRITGVQLSLIETEGRAGQLTIQTPRSIRTAARVNLSGDYLRSIDIDSQNQAAATVEFSRHEFFQLQFDF